MPEPGRNDRCPCGSGRKYKDCCLERDHAPAPLQLVPDARIGDVWEADVVPLPITFDDDRDARPVALLVVAGHQVLHHDIVAHGPVELDDVAALMARGVMAALADPKAKPRAIAVRDERLAAAVGAMLPDMDVRSGAMPALDEAARSLQSHLTGHDHAHPTVSLPRTWKAWRLPAETVSGLFTVAAAFFRARPWRVLENADVLRLETPDAVWWAIVMGNGGEAFGLAMYQRREDIEILLCATGGEPFAEVHGMMVSLTFDRRDDLPTAMQKEILRHGWPVASADAYPLLMTLNTPGGGMTARQAEQLTLALSGAPRLTALLRKHKGGPLPVWRDRATGSTLSVDETGWV